MSRCGRAPSVLLSLVGQDIQGSRTPEMQMREAEAQGLRCVDRLVDATPIGMDAHPDLLRPELWVAEVIDFPLETELLRRARALGCRTIDGGGMALFQAVAAFRLLTGREPDADRMAAQSRSMDAA